MLLLKGWYWRIDIVIFECWDKEGLIEYFNNNNFRKKIYVLE